MARAPWTPGTAPHEDLVRLSYRLKAPDLIWRMMARQGVDPGGAWWRGSEEMLVRAIARCIGCAHADECVSWLERSAPAQKTPAFCPNGRTMEAAVIMADAPAGAGDAADQAPRLRDLLAEPIVQDLMAADGQSEDSLRDAWPLPIKPGR